VNGRTDVWAVALGAPADWPFGRGVGEVGTAAERGTYGVFRTAEEAAAAEYEAVDSGYFATVADVGLVGLAVLLALFGRMLVLARRAIAHGHDAGWFAAALLVVMLLDAVTRASFTGFPTAFLGLLLVGLALAAAAEADDASTARS
jgi:O-antigen ligase